MEPMNIQHTGKTQTEHILYEGFYRHAYWLQWKIFKSDLEHLKVEGGKKKKKQQKHTKTAFHCVFLKVNRNYKISI